MMVEGSAPTQEWLDSNQYSIKSILRYESIFGLNWVSTGGEKTTKEFCDTLGLKAGQRVLDVGCGTGGSAFYMAEHYGVEVLAVDLSKHMVDIACERLLQMSEKVQQKVKFEIADIITTSYNTESFDLIYSRDTILHIPNKKGLFKKLYDYLKPEGTLFITDYCRGDQEQSQQFLDYVKSRGYDLRTVKDYGKILEEAGFRNVEARDNTHNFISILMEELARFQKNKEPFIQKFSQKDYEEIVQGWQDKQIRCRAGDQVWGLFRGIK